MNWLKNQLMELNPFEQRRLIGSFVAGILLPTFVIVVFIIAMMLIGIL